MISWSHSSGIGHTTWSAIVSAIVALVLLGLSHHARADTGYLGPGADEIWRLLSPLVKDRRNVGKLDEKGLATVLSGVQTEDKLEAIAVAYALAFSDSPQADEALGTLQNHPQFTAARETAHFAVVLKATLRLKPQERLAILSYRLGATQFRCERPLLVNWIGSEYGKEAVPLFLHLIETRSLNLKQDLQVFRAEMYTQILLHGDKADAAAAEKLLQKEMAQWDNLSDPHPMIRAFDLMSGESADVPVRTDSAGHLQMKLREKAGN